MLHIAWKVNEQESGAEAKWSTREREDVWKARRDVGGSARVGTHINNARAISRVIDGAPSIMVSEQQQQLQEPSERC